MVVEINAKSLTSFPKAQEPSNWVALCPLSVETPTTEKVCQT